MEHSILKTAARNFYESYNKKDLDKSFYDFVDADVINHTMDGSFVREKWLNFDKAVLTACPNLKLIIKEQFSEGDKVVTHWSCSGTHAAEFFGMAESGNKIQLVVISIDRIENGKIKEHLAMADFTEFMQQFAKK